MHQIGVFLEKNNTLNKKDHLGQKKILPSVVLVQRETVTPHSAKCPDFFLPCAFFVMPAPASSSNEKPKELDLREEALPDFEAPDWSLDEDAEDDLCEQVVNKKEGANQEKEEDEDLSTQLEVSM